MPIIRLNFNFKVNLYRNYQGCGNISFENILTFYIITQYCSYQMQDQIKLKLFPHFSRTPKK
ncbi:unnamed protein product (macronuclear) [Paramecium tetraurelia]|uniref:Uncharacterized protein n=1 Tax=Paramecium tetraurelia TaxID=5888 RepID=A0D408_PARTE|nr:uncharacterized protein GSPATT00013240001 [Paramecium tetraurelia]CAK77775.1 unnamed protein product [Paramecium tetraurelia]|eukprot:XP_001445172.1 hypothetical protein (macronuclear) [Paramecium tetraurelia strain d4-2]